MVWEFPVACALGDIAHRQVGRQVGYIRTPMSCDMQNRVNNVCSSSSSQPRGKVSDVAQSLAQGAERRELIELVSSSL